MLGPLVLNVANRHPGVLANMAATLQTISGGRLLLGLGAGGSRRTPYAVEQAAIGQTVDKDAVRAQRVVDAITLIRKLWGGEAGFLRPSPPPPIVVGGFGPRMGSIRRRSILSLPSSSAPRVTSTRRPGVEHRSSWSPYSRGWRIVGFAPIHARGRWSSAPASID